MSSFVVHILFVLNSFLLAESGYVASLEQSGEDLILEFLGLILQAPAVLDNIKHLLQIVPALLQCPVKSCQLREDNENRIVLQLMSPFFHESVFRDILSCPRFRIMMSDMRTHKPYQIYGSDIVSLTFFILSVIHPAGIADASLEPICLRRTLYLHDKHGIIPVPAHEVVSELLVLIQLSLVLCRAVLNILNHLSFGKQHVDHRHDHILVPPVAENSLETPVSQQAHILLDHLCLFHILSHDFFAAKFHRLIRIPKKYTDNFKNRGFSQLRQCFGVRNLAKNLRFYVWPKT